MRGPVTGSDAVIERRGVVDVLRWPALDGGGVDAVVTTRHGGVSSGPYASLNLGLHVGDDATAVIENRRRAATAIDLDLEDLVLARQVHGGEVALVGRGDRGRGARSGADAAADADALVTRDRGVGLVVLVADCVPVLLHDPVTSTLACVHAGWRGTVARVVAAALDAMREQGARPQDVVAGIGPAVPAARYEVGEDVAAAARAAFGWRARDLLEPDRGRWRFDLWAATRVVLEEAGVPAANVLSGEVPTGGGGPFWSDRAVRPCGRFALLARLR